jgi:hypothetical protein
MHICSGRRSNGRRCYYLATRNVQGRWYCHRHKPKDKPKLKLIPKADLLRLAALSPSNGKDRLEVFVSFHAVLNELLALRGIKHGGK